MLELPHSRLRECPLYLDLGSPTHSAARAQLGRHDLPWPSGEAAVAAFRRARRLSGVLRSHRSGKRARLRIARAAGLPLRIAAKIPRSESRYFREKIRPLLDGNRIEFIGEVGEREKAEFLGNATALLFPIDWPEPFGLVMIEAMACGTPVIAWRRGSVPEIIDHGTTGFIVESEAEAVEAIGRIHELDRRAIRAVFENRFTARRMAEEYLGCFEELSARREDLSTPQSIAPDLGGVVSNQVVAP